MSLGPIMLDLRGPVLQDDEKEFLQHPLVGGVILFSRNYEDPEQLAHLTQSIHSLRQPRLLIAVDHEGGRVQRFREGFTQLPACALFGQLYAEEKQEAMHLAENAGWLLAAELLAVGVDFSFAPVLDIDTGKSSVIGDRAFHSDPDIAATLARCFMQGMNAAGMAAVGKHFPGHGYVKEDSHHEIPVDERRYEDIQMCDLIPYERLIAAGLPAIMPAHVIFSAVDDKPAGFSARWLKEVLRKRLGFKGVIFSDDLSMAGAGVAGDYHARARLALTAGCDMVLVCNNQQAAVRLLDQLALLPDPVAQVRLMRMHGRDVSDNLQQLMQTEKWQGIAAELNNLNKTPELNLGDDYVQS